MVKKKSWTERFGARLAHARDKVNQQAKQKAEKKKTDTAQVKGAERVLRVHPHDAGAGGITAVRVGAVVGTNARGGGK
jgi:hypothetical protein